MRESAEHSYAVAPTLVSQLRRWGGGGCGYTTRIPHKESGRGSCLTGSSQTAIEPQSWEDPKDCSDSHEQKKQTRTHSQ